MKSLCRNALPITLVAALCLLVASPAMAAIDMMTVLNPLNQLHGGFLTVIQVACAAGALIAIAFIRTAPSAAFLALIVIILIFIVATAALS